MPNSSQRSPNTSRPQKSPHQEALRRAEELRRRIKHRVDCKALAKRFENGSVRQESIAALTYVIWQIEGELIARRMGDHSKPRESMLRRQLYAAETTLRYLEKADQAAQERQLSAVGVARSAPNHLSAMVMQHLGGVAFQEDLRRVLAEDGLPPNAIHPPSDGNYSWARDIGLLPAPKHHVQTFLQSSDEDFIEAMLEDASHPGLLPDHPLIARRRVALDRPAMQRARYRNGKVEQQVANLSQQQRGYKQFESIRKVYHQAGILALRQRQAKALLSEYRVTVKKLSRSARFMKMRADYLQKAAELAAQRDPALWQTVLQAVVIHQQSCPEVGSHYPCRNCAPEIVALIKGKKRNKQEQPPTSKDPAADESQNETAETPAPEPGNEARPEPPQVGPREEALLVAIAASANSKSSTVGLAWVTEDGQIGVANDIAPDLLEARTLAICRAIAELQSTDQPLDIIVPDARARDRARWLLKRKRDDIPHAEVSREVRAFLHHLTGQQGRIQILSPKDLQRDVNLVNASSELAKLALSSVRGGLSQRALQRKIDDMASKFGIHDAERLTSPRQATPQPRVHHGKHESRWKQTLRASHLADAVFPLPPEIRKTISRRHGKTSLSLTLYHRSATCPGDKLVTRLRSGSRTDHLRLDGVRWPADFFGGIQMECTWNPARRTLTAKTMRLRTPLRVNDQTVGYVYDPLVLTRETAPGGPEWHRPLQLSTENWVLRTMQILGYLDAEGRAVLAEEALEHNMVELGFPVDQLPRITAAVAALLRDGELQRVQGSLGPGGYPIYPAIRHRPAVDLLSFQPRITEDQEAGRRHQLKSTQMKRPHYVSGFVRRLPLGQSASDEAIQAHAEAQRHARVANDGPLKPGYTFVRKHRRNDQRR